MASSKEILNSLWEQGIEFWLESHDDNVTTDNRLRFRGNKTLLPESVLQQLRDHKANIIKILLAEPERYKGYPLSEGQKSIYLMQSLLPSSCAYNQVCLLTLSTPLETQQLEKSIHLLLNKHPSLRARVNQHKGVLSQQINFAASDIYTDHITILNDKMASQTWFKKHADYHFDLHNEPLIRMHLSKDAANNYQLLLVAHHLIADYWTLQLVLKDLNAIYRDFPTQYVAENLTQQKSYKDFVIEEQQWLNSPAAETSKQYWRQQLSPLPSALKLPTDFAISSDHKQLGRELTFGLSAAIVRSIKEAAKSHQVTPFIWILSCFQLLLHRYTREDNIIVGIPMACRMQSYRQGLAGHFTNLLPHITTLDQSLTFEALLNINKEQMYYAQKYQDYPTQQLLDTLGLTDNASTRTLFQAVISWNQLQNIEDEEQQLINDIVMMEQRGAIYDLTLNAYDLGEDIKFSIRYNSEVFKKNTVSRITQHLQNIISHSINTTSAAISSIDYLTKKELDCIRRINQTQTEYPKNVNLSHIFSNTAALHPSAIAYKKDSIAFTYHDLQTHSNKTANYLKNQGLSADSYIAICMDRSFEMLTCILACLKNNCAYVPIDPSYPTDRIQFMLESTSAPFLLSLSTHVDTVKSLDLTETQAIFIDHQKIEIDKQSSDFPLQKTEITADTVACVLFTSGSTGKPKGVSIPHNAISRLSLNTDYVTIKPGDRFCYLSNVSFDATNIETWLSLLNGAILLCIDNHTLLDPKRFANFIALEQPSAAMITTALFNLYISYQPDLFKHLNYLLVGGETLDVNHIRTCINEGKPKHLLNLYGPTENGTVSTAYEIINLGDDETSVPIGTPIHNSQAYILDQYQQFTSFGAIGEIVVGGDGIALGYLNQPELTIEKFKHHDFTNNGKLYATGDLGYLREDGVIIYTGRLDDQVKIRGYRIELGEIEQYLSLHPKIEHCCVIAINTADSLYLAAYFTGSKHVKQQQLKHYLRRELPNFMIPSAFMQLDKLPINANGKIDKKQLPDITPHSNHEYAEANTGNEKLIKHIWEKFLNFTEIGIHDNFFDLGGHSLMAVRVASEIQDRLDKEITIRMIFDHPSIAELAKAVDAVENTYLPKIKHYETNQAIPAATLQQRLWFLQQLEPNSTAYNMPAAIRLKTPINSNDIEESINKLIIRHDILRTSFTDIDGQAFLQVEDNLQLTLPSIDLSRLPIAHALQAAQQQINDIANSSFSLASPSLFKVRFIKLGTNDHVLIFCLHHIIADGWSVDILLSELAELISNKNSILNTIHYSYTDYNIWQRQWLQEYALKKQLTYWKQQLYGVTPFINLPNDKPRPSLLKTKGKTFDFTIPNQSTAALHSFANDRNMSLFMSLLTAYSLLISRYSCQYDFCIGFPTSGRTHRETESIVGLFVNNLAIRCRLDNVLSVDDYAQQLRQTILEAYANQDAPFDLVIDTLKLERSLSYTPLLQASFSLEAESLAKKVKHMFGTHAELIDTDRNTAKYELNLICYESTETISASLEYNSDLYTENTIARMAKHFIEIIGTMTTNTSIKTNQLQTLSQYDQEQLLEQWTDEEKKPTRPIVNVANAFEIQASKAPKELAACFNSTNISYLALNKKANQIAHCLIKNGIKPNDFIGIYLQRGIDQLASIIAVLKTGAAYIPLDVNLPKNRIQYILDDAKPCHLLTDLEYTRLFPQQSTIVIGNNADIINASTDNPNIYIANHTAAYVIYTSGTTGKPKACITSHQNLARLFTTTDSKFHFNDKDIWTLFHSYAFDVSVWEMWGALLYGGKLVIVPQWMTRASDAFYQLLIDEHVTILNQTPSAFSQLIRIDEDFDDNSLSLRSIIFAGEALDFVALRQWEKRHSLARTELINMYGITETTIHASYHKISQEDLVNGRSIIGNPLSDLHFYLLDQHKQLVPIGVSGEIHVSGAGVSRGYLHQQQLTEERFIDNNYVNELPEKQQNKHNTLYCSGDLARWLDNGTLEYLGRIDHQVKIRGHRIELGEIESCLSQQTPIQESLVIAEERDNNDKRLIAYLLCTDDIDIDEIRQHLKYALPDYMIPSAFVTVTEWPLTDNGKINTSKLPAPKQHTLSSQSYVAPRNDTEASICLIWSEILDIEKIGVHDNFFELGGHSLLATQVISRIRKDLTCSLELKTLFENPSIAELALMILSQEVQSMNIHDDELSAMIDEIGKE